MRALAETQGSEGVSLPLGDGAFFSPSVLVTWRWARHSWPARPPLPSTCSCWNPLEERWTEPCFCICRMPRGSL